MQRVYRSYSRSALSAGDIVILYAIFFFATLFIRDVGSLVMDSQSHQSIAPQISTVFAAADQAPSAPARLIIPKLGIDAPVQSVGKTAKGAMGIPTGDNRYQEVGWFNLGPKPGEKGNAVIDGHLDTRSFAPGIFRDLNKLQQGDLVEIVDMSGQMFQFRVTGSASVSKQTDTDAVFGPYPTARLNLITCSGDWVQDEKQYDERLVVFTELIH